MRIPRYGLAISSLLALAAGLSLFSLSSLARSVPKREPPPSCHADAYGTSDAQTQGFEEPCELARNLALHYDVTLDGLLTSSSLPKELVSPSVCSTVFFSVMSACVACRDAAELPHWSQWSANCSTTYVVHLPDPTPTNVRLPAWAYADVTLNDVFDAAVPHLAGHELRVNPRQYDFPSYSISVPSYTFSYSIPSYTFSYSIPSYTFSYSLPSYSFSIPSYTIPSYSFPTPTYDFPTDIPANTAPSFPTGLSTPSEHGGGGGGGGGFSGGSSSKRKVNLKAIIGSVVGAISSVTAFIGGVWACMKRRAKRALGMSQGDNAHMAEQQKPLVINNYAAYMPHVSYAHPAPPPPGTYVPTSY